MATSTDTSEVLAQYWCDTLCGSSVETSSSPLIDTHIRCPVFASAGVPMESDLFHGDCNASFAMVASHLEVFRVLHTPVLMGLINSSIITVTGATALHNQ
eukprot:scaffold93307_cov34-Attheya_sp.AAC.4